MSKNKRKSGSENAVEKKDDRTKSNRGKGVKTGLATLGVCASAFGAYYSPHFRTASSDWLERGRAFFAKRLPFDFWAEENAATADEKMREKLAQAPSFRDFLTEEYGEDGARELLGIDATTADASTFRAAPELEPKTTFADYVAAESASLETTESQGVAVDVGASSFRSAPELEPKATFADYVAESDGADSEKNGAAATSEKTRLASENESVAATVSSEDEATLAARLQAEMKERGVGNPRIERWGGRFWRASGFATTNEGVATFCEAVDVDPTAAQQAALAKFDAAKF